MLLVFLWVKKMWSVILFMDSSLGFEHHIRHVCRTAFAHLHVISRVSKNISHSHRLLLIRALVLSRIDFCCSLFYGVSGESMRRLNRIITSSLSLLLGLKKRTSADIQAELKRQRWLTVQQKINYRLLVITYEALSGRGPVFFQINSNLYLITICSVPYQIINLRFHFAEPQSDSDHSLM
jgi:hypothetical protein